MVIKEATLVRHKKSKLIYRLLPKGKDIYCLSANDGMVPSSQIIFYTPEDLDNIFELIKE